MNSIIHYLLVQNQYLLQIISYLCNFICKFIPLKQFAFDDSNYAVALWVCYYNFLRPHQFNNYQVLNKIDILEGADTMQAKWQLIIYLGQKTILNMQSNSDNT